MQKKVFYFDKITLNEFRLALINSFIKKKGFRTQKKFLIYYAENVLKEEFTDELWNKLRRPWRKPFHVSDSVLISFEKELGIDRQIIIEEWSKKYRSDLTELINNSVYAKDIAFASHVPD